MRTTLAIAIAGAMGVLARHAVQHFVSRPGSSVPWGTFVVNVSGAFAVGFLFTVLVRHFGVPMWLQEATLVGFLGGYTTFSALALETYVLGEHHRYALAAAYSLGTLLVGVFALIVGIHLARRL
jgi:CrcB protein